MTHSQENLRAGGSRVQRTRVNEIDPRSVCDRASQRRPCAAGSDSVHRGIESAADASSGLRDGKPRAAVAGPGAGRIAAHHSPDTGRQDPGSLPSRLSRPQPVNERRKEVLLAGDRRHVETPHRRRLWPLRRCPGPQCPPLVHPLRTALPLFAAGDTPGRRVPACSVLCRGQSGRHHLGDRSR